MPTLHFRYGTQWDWQPYDPSTNLGGEGGIQQYPMGEQKVHFDGINKYIVINVGFSDINVQTDVYSAWKEWKQNLDNSKYPQALTAIGGDPITGTSSVGITYFLENGWRLKLPEIDGNYTIDGNLYTREPGEAPVLPPDGQFDTAVEFIRSNIVDLITVAGGGSGISNAEMEAIALAVWNTLLQDVTVPETMGTFVKERLLTKNQFLGLKD